MFLIWLERFLGLCVTKSQQQAQTLLAEDIINFDQAATSPRISAAAVAECLETIMSLYIPIFLENLLAARKEYFPSIN